MLNLFNLHFSRCYFHLLFRSLLFRFESFSDVLLFFDTVIRLYYLLSLVFSVVFQHHFSPLLLVVTMTIFASQSIVKMYLNSVFLFVVKRIRDILLFLLLSENTCSLHHRNTQFNLFCATQSHRIRVSSFVHNLTVLIIEDCLLLFWN